MLRNTVALDDDSNARTDWASPDVDDYRNVPASESPFRAAKDISPDDAGVLVVVRHGQSVANQWGRISGWGDHDLTDRGEQDARDAAARLAAAGIQFDEIHTSVLSRTLSTARIIEENVGYPIPRHHRSWRLNERHYGALQDRTWEDIKREHGEAQFEEWYYDFDSAPPPLDPEDPRHPRHQDDKYELVPPNELPCRESLKDTVARVLPYWRDTLRPTLSSGRNVLVVGHQKALGALAQLVGMPTPSVADNNAPWDLKNGIPVEYRARGGSPGGGARANGATIPVTYHPTTDHRPGELRHGHPRARPRTESR